MISLDEFISLSVTPVLLDSGVRTTSSNGWYRKIYTITDSNKLDFSTMRQVALSYDKYYRDFLNPAVYTVSGVASELRAFQDIVSKKISFLNSRRGANSSKINSLGEVALSLKKSAQRAEKKSISPRNSVFNNLYESALIAGRTPGVKIDFSSPVSSTETKSEYHTDEQLVATAFYLGLSRQCSLVTTDSDLSRIGAAVLSMNPNIQEHIDKNLFLYLVRDDMVVEDSFINTAYSS